ncbi:MAG: hydantoinase B/oxoprolinase family protein, partial [Pseudomonadota bacterium]|nr:hydantoinase B/oxoprolinase family protein [Pseudomonadota bacterium]
ALLENTGEPTLLITTCGFRDALKIGHQNRPNLFDLNIVPPQQLYGDVLEVEERINAKGEIISELNGKKAAINIKKFFKEGFRAAAIVLMHGYLNAVHEKKLIKILEETGFTQISASHEVSPLIKLIARGDTTVIDAYLSPVIKRYANYLKFQLPGVPLMFMQSSGGLTGANLFRGKNSILSGPAGGVVAAVETASRSDFNNIIGFDMGGTSTDVFHFAGSFEKKFETQIAGIRIQTPMMNIHTVAAGGGSILKFDGARFRVGPSSAGANPGPASYGRGGPLTLTDANLILGRIQPDFFPKIFGQTEKMPLDINIATKQFNTLLEEINTNLGKTFSLEEVAEGFLKVAVENMANAIKKISVQKGYDVRNYTLVCYGGAAGQHACLVAQSLGISNIHINPLAGLLSAYGMGVAKTSAAKTRSFEMELNHSNETQMYLLTNDLVHGVRQELLGQNIPDQQIDYVLIAHVRYSGSDSTIEVQINSADLMKEAFEECHLSLFGFKDHTRAIVIASITVEGLGAARNIKTSTRPNTKNSKTPKVASHIMLYSNNHRSVPVYRRNILTPYNQIVGPAVVTEDHATTIIEKDWTGIIDKHNNLILSHTAKITAITDTGIGANPIMLEIFNNLFMSVAEQMGIVLAKTASSINIKERLDFSCAIFDASGELIANAPHLPIHLGSMGESVKAIVRARGNTILPGQTFALNDPYNGGTHLPDITVISPVFSEDNKNILFFVGSRGHHADIGGTSPGSIPPFSASIEEEGVLVTNFLLVENGQLRERELEELLTSCDFPARNPRQNISDFKAQIAANETGIRELKRIIEYYGLKLVSTYMNYIKENAEESVRKVLDVLKEGEFTLNLDHGGKIKVSITIDKRDRKAVIDFTGTSAQLNSNFNAPKAVTHAAVLYVFRCLVDDDIPLNEGCLRPLEIVIPEGCFLNPSYPAAVVAGNVETAQAVASALFGVTATLAASQTTMNNFTFGNDSYQYYETICGGSGAGPGFCGTDAVHTHMTNTRLTDPEILEWRYPVMLNSFQIRNGSGGTGKYTGGNGVIRRLKFLESMNAAIVSSSRKIPPFGLKGGDPGKVGYNYIEDSNGIRKDLTGSDQVKVRAGDVFVIETPGGGGFEQR